MGYYPLPVHLDLARKFAVRLRKQDGFSRDGHQPIYRIIQRIVTAETREQAFEFATRLFPNCLILTVSDLGS